MGDVSIVQQFDVDFIKRTITHPRIWPWVSCDGQIAADYEFGGGAIAFSPVMDGKPMGVYIVEPRNSVMVEIHTALLPEFWHKTDEAAQAMVDHLASCGINTIVTMVPEHNKRALRYALRNGFELLCTIPKSIAQNGLKDQYFLRKALCQQQQLSEDL